jgi:CTP synthase (UTP-ammonia lyase)
MGMSPQPRIAVLGDRDPSLTTHRELDATLALLGADVDASWCATDGADAARPEAFDGLWVAPGTPYRDGDAVLAAIGHARRSGTPLLGTCGGFQYTALALARELAGVAAAHAETDPAAPEPFVAPLACALYGEERTVTCVPGTLLAAILGPAPFAGFHFCGYGLAPGAAAVLEQAGVRIAAHAPHAGVEAFELPGHPFFVATLFQPQVGSLSGAALSPLIAAFVAAARAGAGH